MEWIIDLDVIQMIVILYFECQDLLGFLNQQPFYLS